MTSAVDSAMYAEPPVCQELRLFVSTAHHPALRCDASSFDRDLSLRHFQLPGWLGWTVATSLALRLVSSGLPPPLGPVTGAIVSSGGSLLPMSMGCQVWGGGGGNASLAFLLAMAAMRLAWILARIAGVRGAGCFGVSLAVAGVAVGGPLLLLPLSLDCCC